MCSKRTFARHSNGRFEVEGEVILRTVTEVTVPVGRCGGRMRCIVKVVLAIVLLGSTGCVVHDKSRAPEPIWWPNFVARESTFAASGGHLNVQVADPLLPPLSADPPIGRRAD